MKTMLRREAAFIFPLLLLCALASCERSPFHPDVEENREILVDNVQVRVTVEPAEVEPADSFTVRVAFTNVSSDTAVWRTYTRGCLVSEVLVLSDQEDARFQGSSFHGCRIEPTEWPIPPGESIERSWTLVAQTRVGSPVSPGEYIVQVALGQRSHTERYPLLRQRLLVR